MAALENHRRGIINCLLDSATAPAPLSSENNPSLLSHLLLVAPSSIRGFFYLCSTRRTGVARSVNFSIPLDDLPPDILLCGATVKKKHSTCSWEAATTQGNGVFLISPTRAHAALSSCRSRKEIRTRRCVPSIH
jgi:hypothetical protein